MPRDVSGTTQPLPGTIVSTGDTILPSQHNPMVNDVYAMMTQSLSRDGQGGMRAPLDMSNFRVINVGQAINPGDAVPLSQFQAGTPIGTVADFAGSSAPDTWMLCYGQAISRSEYATLFSVIGTTFGPGDGSTTFNIPDCRGRVTAGKDNMGGTNANRLTAGSGFPPNSSVGQSGGFDLVTLSIQNLPPHSHGGFTGVGGEHTHDYLGGSDAQILSGTGSIAVPRFYNQFRQTGTIGSAHSHVINPEGGNMGHNNVQPTILFNKIIRVTV